MTRGRRAAGDGWRRVTRAGGRSWGEAAPWRAALCALAGCRFAVCGRRCAALLLRPGLMNSFACVALRRESNRSGSGPLQEQIKALHAHVRTHARTQAETTTHTTGGSTCTARRAPDKWVLLAPSGRQGGKKRRRAARRYAVCTPSRRRAAQGKGSPALQAGRGLHLARSRACAGARPAERYREKEKARLARGLLLVIPQLYMQK